MDYTPNFFFYPAVGQHEGSRLNGLLHRRSQRKIRKDARRCGKTVKQLRFMKSRKD